LLLQFNMVHMFLQL